jgi:hypothetical protein
MKMYDVYSSEEADDFKTDRMKDLKDENERLKGQLKTNTALLRSMTDYITLPEGDPKYPGERIVDLWNVHKDEVYITQLTKNEDPLVAWMANGLVRRIQFTRRSEAAEANPPAETTTTENQAVAAK